MCVNVKSFVIYNSLVRMNFAINFKHKNPIVQHLVFHFFSRVYVCITFVHVHVCVRACVCVCARAIVCVCVFVSEIVFFFQKVK